MPESKIKTLAEQNVRVTIEGTMENVLKRLKLSRPESLALTAFALKDGEIETHLEGWINIKMEIVK